MQINWSFLTKGDSRKTPILFLHGFMGDSKIWLPCMDALQSNFFCAAPDLPGHGKTEAESSKVDFDTVADAIAALCREKFGRPAVLVGYSMGGRIALYTALKYHELFTALVLESATAGIEDEDERRERSAADEAQAERLRTMDMRKFLIEWYRQPVFAWLQEKPETIQKIIDKKSSNDGKKLAEVIVRLSPGKQRPLWSELRSWDKPTLIIAGAMDDKYCDLGRRLNGLIPDSRLEIIEGAGHIVHLEARDKFIEVLKNFLGRYILRD